MERARRKFPAISTTGDRICDAENREEEMEEEEEQVFFFLKKSLVRILNQGTVLPWMLIIKGARGKLSVRLFIISFSFHLMELTNYAMPLQHWRSFGQLCELIR